MEKVKYNCQEFELFRGNICHMVKEYGQLQFLENMLISNQVENPHRSLFNLAKIA